MAFNFKNITSLPEIPNFPNKFETVITKLSDLPEPIAGEIFLEDNITYRFQGLVDIGDNTLVAGVSNTIFGFDKSNDGIICNDVAIKSLNQTLSINNILINSVISCVVFTNDATHSAQIRECILFGGQAGNITGGDIVTINNNSINTLYGFDFIGNINKLAIASNFFNNSLALRHIDIENGTYETIKIIDNVFDNDSPNIAISVAGNVIITNNGGGSIVSNSFSGSGTYISGIQDDTLDWIIEANGSQILSTSARRFIRKIRNEEQLDEFLLLPDVSDYVYEIDGNINITTTKTIPDSGMTFRGYGNNFSTISTNVTGLTIFNGSGNAFFNDLKLSCTGAGSKIFDMSANTGFEAVEFVNVNFENCEDIGILDGFRQGLLLNGFMLGVKQGFLFRGTWAGGFRIDASRFIFTVAGSTYMFKTDVGHTFGSRFFSNANSTIASGATGYDFIESNFVNDGTFQMIESENTGAGIYVNPLLDASSVKSLWRDNIGLDDTFQGIVSDNISDTITPIASPSTYYEMLCDIDVIESAWFTSNSGTTFETNYDSNIPINISIQLFLSISSSNNNEIEVEIRNYRTSLVGGFDSLGSFKLTTNGGVLGTRVESTSLKTFDRVLKDDRIRIFVRNNTGGNDVSLDASSKLIITKR